MINLYQKTIQEVDENENNSLPYKNSSILARIHEKIINEKKYKEQKSKLTTNPNSKTNFQAFLERNSNLLKSKSQKVLKMKENLQEKELHGCVFKPKTNKYIKPKETKSQFEVIYNGKRHMMFL